MNDQTKINEATAIEIELPEKLHVLLTESARFKVLLGGRGSAKTESAARALIIFASQMRLRIACFRELQNSIDESSYSTIKNIILDTWKDGSWVFEWDIQKTTIISKRTGSEFIFSGLRYKIDSVKSMARIDIAWVDEARNCSKTTLDKLAPTIRGMMEKDEYGNYKTTGGPFGKGPEIWYTYNPELESDEIYKRTVVQKDKYFPDYVMNDETGEMERYAIVLKVNWQDNRFFPEDLRQQMAVMRAASLKDEEDTEYLHVWEGHVKTVLEGAIYSKEIKNILKEGRRKRVPYIPNKPVLTYWDLGHSDKTAIWFMQYNGLEYNFIHYYENRLQKMGHYIEYLQECKYIYSVHNLPHDGDAETLSNVTPRKQLKTAFPNSNVRIIDRPSKKIVGINAVRTILDLCNFDENDTSEGWACLCNYSYKVLESGQFSKEPDHDTPWSHGCFTADTKILTRKGLEAISTLPETGEVWTQFGWQPYLNPHLTRKNASLVEVSFTDGLSVKCTPDHFFLTVNGWKFAKDLEKGLLIQSGLAKKSNSLMIEFTKSMGRINILKPLAHFTGMFGQMLSGLYQKVAISTTKMKLNQIMEYAIWNAYLGRNIYSLAGNYLELKAMTLPLIKKLETTQHYGINQKKVESGTRIMLGTWLQEQKNSVFSVVLNFKERLDKSFARQNVKLTIDLKEEMSGQKSILQKIEFVKNVMLNSFRKDNAADQTLDIAPINAGQLRIKEIKILDEQQNVYCLTVPSCGHFAIANGAIVKNSDALQTFGLSIKPEKPITPKTVGSNKNTVRNLHRSTSWMG